MHKGRVFMDRSVIIRIKKEELEKKRSSNVENLKIWREKTNLEWVYNSVTEQGNTLTFEEVKIILEKEVTVAGKKVKEHLEVMNYRNAITFMDCLIERKMKITKVTIQGLNKLILLRIDMENAGKYRVYKENGKITKDTERELEAFVKWINYKGNGSDTISGICNSFWKFIQMNIFVNKNFETGFLFLNLRLMQNGYPPIYIKREAQEYAIFLLSLTNVSSSKFVEFIESKIIEALYNCLRVCN